jgi:hypothetical protein
MKQTHLIVLGLLAYLILLAVIFLHHGHEKSQPIIIQSSPQQSLPEKPPVIVTPPVVTPPVTPMTQAYIAGYNDGYYGTWLSPLRWTFGEEYRNGWSAGHWDRCHGNPNQHKGNKWF